MASTKNSNKSKDVNELTTPAKVLFQPCEVGNLFLFYVKIQSLPHIEHSVYIKKQDVQRTCQRSNESR